MVFVDARSQIYREINYPRVFYNAHLSYFHAESCIVPIYGCSADNERIGRRALLLLRLYGKRQLCEGFVTEMCK